MKLAIFANPHGLHSMDRLAGGLTANFPPDVDVELVTIDVRPGVKGKVWDRYIRYPLKARRVRADRYLIASEGFAFLLAALDRRRTWVVCLDVHALLDRTIRRHNRWLYRGNLRMMARAAGIVAISEHTREDLLKLCPFVPPERVAVVHPGVDDAWAADADEAELQLLRRRHGLDGRRFVLSVGSSVWYKNTPGVLQSFARLRGADLLVRVGPLSPAEMDLARQLGIADRIRCLDGLSDNELRLLYRSAAVLLFPSLHEGFGWPPAEAMASGCPVVASARASLPEVCGEACHYVDPTDPRDIAAGVQQVLDDPSYRDELVRRGRLQAAGFNWGKTARRMLSLMRV